MNCSQTNDSDQTTRLPSCDAARDQSATCITVLPCCAVAGGYPSAQDNFQKLASSFREDRRIGVVKHRGWSTCGTGFSSSFVSRSAPECATHVGHHERSHGLLIVKAALCVPRLPDCRRAPQVIGDGWRTTWNPNTDFSVVICCRFGQTLLMYCFQFQN